jgi:predicted transcriptional regulator YheO
MGWFDGVVSDLTVSLLIGGAGFLVGRYRERLKFAGRDLHEYDFYPYVATDEGFTAFSSENFKRAIQHFLRDIDRRAARQLIFIGEQNDVRRNLNADDLRAYDRLCGRYDASSVSDDTRNFLENYRNIVRLLGQTFRGMGVEILLHDLSDPSHSIIAIENGEVTGRSLQMGTTTLLMDLRRRVNLREDKLNYELNIGARKFKCTTIPIIRREFGVVGAICMNIDVNYVQDHVLASAERIAEFFRSYSQTDMALDENILSKGEYQKALAGKKHFRDASVPAN